MNVDIDYQGYNGILQALFHIPLLEELHETMKTIHGSDDNSCYVAIKHCDANLKNCAVTWQFA